MSRLQQFGCCCSVAWIIHLVIQLLFEFLKRADLLLAYVDGPLVHTSQPPAPHHLTYELHASHVSTQRHLPVYESKLFTQPLGTFFVESNPGIIVKVRNPLQTFSVLEPGHEGGCAEGLRTTVAESGKQRDCLVAMNAGFFNVTSFRCKGNLVVDGKVVQTSGPGIQNAHFGIKKDSSIFSGYLPDSADLDEFQQLIGGVVWLVRDGENYIEEAIKLEFPDTQETGTLRTFVDALSGRAAIGHDRDGHVVMAQVDGRTFQRGIGLHDFADMLVAMGVVNAVNLDGGGSVTMVMNGTVVSHPTDQIVENKTLYWNAPRDVSSIVCVHNLPCSPAGCSNHGDCVHGACVCHEMFAGPGCEHLQCGALNCSGHGKCTQAGCDCGLGWQGPDCNQPCPLGLYGEGCAHTCQCVHADLCHSEDGSCVCQPGYTGLMCDQECPYGHYGPGCSEVCHCADSCFCDHITGACNVSIHGSSIESASQCLAEKYITERSLVPDNSQELRLWVALTTVLVAVVTVSLALNVCLFCLHCSCNVFSCPTCTLTRLREGPPPLHGQTGHQKGPNELGG